ncbi:uncharacterized protein LOC128882354 [Hylaeus volcanicus]|uniref:uncharacterized protein LOC128882354 n=1 Tax=Hylaeus volcanicus TaxID=313075 RepID=UPI0023B81AFE|nr:uncharacterized protein LOC128882354 [Hylaeus volcanicus]
MFEQQNKNMGGLIAALQSPKPVYRGELPEFDPERQDTDARSWCTTADLCFSENPPSGGQLVLAVSKALKGEASSWLSQVAYEGMTWSEFKTLFTSRFISTETLAGTLIKMNSEKPSEKETLPAFASCLIASLTNRWKDVSKEEIAVATVLAHISQFDSHLQRMAFTTNIASMDKLQQELNAFSHLKRKINNTVESSNTVDIMRAKMTSIKCFNCGKTGHRRAECRNKPVDTKGRPTTSTSSSSQATQQPAAKPLVCFKCGTPGHIAVRCTHNGDDPSNDGAGAARSERRVDVCVVQPSTGKLQHKGVLLCFTFDSGAECSLVKESFSSKFSGKHFDNVVAMTGIGQTRVFSTEQILCCVEINDHPLEILLHVLPDKYLQNDVMLGREILNQEFSVNMTATELSLTKVLLQNDVMLGREILNQEFSVNMTATELSLTKVLCVNSVSHNNDGTRQSELTNIKTDVSGNDKSRLLNRLNQFSEFFITGLPTPRVNTDYRELNSNTVPDRYPLPLITDQIARLHGPNLFSKLDCASGFHLIPVGEESIESTAFITSEGQYEFLTMPFGLKNAISVFQRVIMNALGDLAHDYVIVYVDDILIVSPDVESGLQRLLTVLEVLTRAGFSLNLRKCSFLKTKVEFLGFEVESGQISPNCRKVEALTALPPPETVTQLRQFIDLATYFRQFVKDFSRIMTPLYRLTSLKGELTWKPEHEDIRQKIISIMTNELVLTIYDPELPVELHTDASNLGYGAVLFQVKGDDKRCVVAYFSKRTSPAENKYYSYELETLAIVNSIKHFKQYLHGRRFTVVTDCNLAEQQCDEEISKIMTDLEKHQLEKELAKTCVVRSGVFHRKVQAELHPIPKVTTPWHTVHINVTGKLSGKNDKKEYIFVLINALTKYVLLYHTTNINSNSSIHAVTQSTFMY